MGKQPTLKLNKPASAASKGQPTQAGITIIVQADQAFEPFQVGDHLTGEKQVAEYFKGMIAHSDADQETKDNVEKASNAAVCAVVKKTDVSEAGNDVATANMLRMTAVGNARFAMADASQVPTLATLRIASSAGDFAVKLGAQVPDDMVRETDDIILSILKGDAGPTLLAMEMREKWKDLQEGKKPWLECVPPIGSRYQTHSTGKGNKPPAGYALPSERGKTNLPIWEGPYDYYTAEVIDEHGVKDKKGRHFVAEFVAKKIAYGMTERLDNIRIAKSTKVVQEGCPSDLRKELDAILKDADNRDRILDELIADIGYQFNRRVRVWGSAFEILQGGQAITGALPNVSVVLTATTPGFANKKTLQEQARSKKPFSLKSRVPTEGKPGEFDTSYLGPYPVALVRGAAKKIAWLRETKPDGFTLADFLAPKPKGTSAAPTPAGAGVPIIETVDKFASHLTEVWGYLRGDKGDVVRARANDPVKGPEFCAMLVRVHSTLTDFVNIKGVTEKAVAFEDTLSEKQGERAEAEAKSAA